MKRVLNWVLGGMAVLVAVVAIGKRARRPAENPDPKPEPVPPDARYSRARALSKGLLTRLSEHHTPMIAGSLSYYAFLAIFPAAIAAISIYGLVLNPATLGKQLESLANVLPASAATLVHGELNNIVQSSEAGLTIATVLGIAAALWSASAGTRALIIGIDIAYDTPESRPFLLMRGLALLVTLGIVAFVVTAASAVTFLPDLLSSIGGGATTRRLIEFGRWPALFVFVVVGLGLLYKLAPDRPARKSPWISVGAIVAATLWMLATVGFSIYANGAKGLGATYGALGGVIVLLLWFFISGLIVLLGAELNAELEQQRSADAQSMWRGAIGSKLMHMFRTRRRRSGPPSN